MAGQRFGRLLVLTRAPRPKVPGQPRTTGPAKWYCHCDPAYGGCDNFTTVGGNALRSGFTRSCGCLRADVNAARNRKRAAERRAARGL